MGIFNSDSNNSQTSVDKATGTIAGVFNSIKGINRTDSITPIALVGRNGDREKPGFTPNESYTTLDKNDNWFGNLLDTHPDFNGKSSRVLYPRSKSQLNFKELSTSDRFDLSKDFPKVEGEPYSTRDWHVIFNDTSMDYFKHGIQIIEEKNNDLRSEKNSRETWDGSEESTPSRLSQILNDTTGTKGTSYENSDPVMFGFEIIVDLINSPLLNGSVEDFIAQFPYVNEIASRRKVMNDFRQQFLKLFKTKGTFRTVPDKETISIKTSNYANTSAQSKLFSSGKPAYMSYYLKKVGGLENLIETNGPDKRKGLVDYRKDTIKLTFTEDVSLNMGTLAYLYKLLYWSKPNAKNIVPENLLRFNCDIIVSEVRHFNRVRKGASNGDLEVIKDNLSRHIYTLNECQLWFDQPAHEGEVDLGNIKSFDDFVVTMDYKYVTSKFERWTPDGAGFGKYVAYNNGAIWKVGNPGARSVVGATATTIDGYSDDKDIAVPRFYTNSGGNTLRQNGVGTPIIMDSYNRSSVINEPVTNPNPTGGTSSKQGRTTDETEDGNVPDANSSGKSKKKFKEGLDAFKDRSAKAAQNLATSLKSTVEKELKAKINTRLSLLNNTLDKVRNESGVGRMREPTNVYTGVGGPGSPISAAGFFDIQNALRDFAGDSLGGALGGLIKGGNNPLF
jgi:hypothetical protein